MTRKEELITASHDKRNYPCKVIVDKIHDPMIFSIGAEWADQYPSVNTVKKIVCYALKHTNIMLVEDLENGVEWELLIRKAMEE